MGNGLMPWRTTVMSLIALLRGFGLMQTGNTLQGTLLSIRGNIEGFSPIEIGLVGAAFWAGNRGRLALQRNSD
jgi:hypothetical protein